MSYLESPEVLDPVAALSQGTLHLAAWQEPVRQSQQVGAP
jgi:hypothetical protein